MRASNIHVRLLDADRAVVLFEWEILTPGERTSVLSVARGKNLFVVARDPRWTITAGQVARLRPR